MFQFWVPKKQPKVGYQKVTHGHPPGWLSLWSQLKSTTFWCQIWEPKKCPKGGYQKVAPRQQGRPPEVKFKVRGMISLELSSMTSFVFSFLARGDRLWPQTWGLLGNGFLACGSGISDGSGAWLLGGSLPQSAVRAHGVYAEAKRARDFIHLLVSLCCAAERAWVGYAVVRCL